MQTLSYQTELSLESKCPYINYMHINVVTCSLLYVQPLNINKTYFSFSVNGNFILRVLHDLVNVVCTKRYRMSPIHFKFS